MANLIITIIAIALVAIAALMGAYYGGTAFNKGQEKAKASSIMNQAAQIQAAIQMWRVDHGTDFQSDLADLDDADAAYLSSVPEIEGSAWTTSTGAGTITATLDDNSEDFLPTIGSGDDDDVCDFINGTAWTCDASAVTYTF
jgi:type II secretory pathway pseudopilin PulG